MVCRTMLQEADGLCVVCVELSVEVLQLITNDLQNNAKRGWRPPAGVWAQCGDPAVDDQWCAEQI
jgi:hypothetical protein